MDVGVGVCCESPTEEGGAQVDGDGREPGQGCTVVQRTVMEGCTVVQLVVYRVLYISRAGGMEVQTF